MYVSTIIFTIYNFFKQSIIDRKENKLIKEREITILKQKIADLDLTDTKAIKEYKRSYFFPRTKKDELSPDAIETIELIDDIYKNQFIDSIQYFIFNIEYQFLIKMYKKSVAYQDTTRNEVTKIIGGGIEYLTYVINIIIKIVRSFAKFLLVLFLLMVFIGIVLATFIIITLFFSLITPFIISFYKSPLPSFVKVLITIIIIGLIIVLEPKGKENIDD